MPEIVDETFNGVAFELKDSKQIDDPNKQPELSTQQIIQIDRECNAVYYKPVDVAIVKGEGCYCWDPEGKVYFDFAAAQGALNFGHCHPKLVAEVADQMKTLTICSRAFYNDQLSLFCKEVGEAFGYEKVAPLNSGVEAAEAAIKLARKWGATVKKVPESRNKVVVCKNGFFGRSITAVSASCDKAMYDGYGPHLPGFTIVPFNDIVALERALEGDPFVSAFYVEPVQGEAGVFVPSIKYLKECEKVCRKYNVLFIVDEVQTGMGRTGKLASYMHSGAKPDIVVLGKSLSGGLLPVSAILSSKKIMDCFGPNGHGSTFGGCAIACRAGRAALKILKEENLVERAAELGDLIMSRMEEWKGTFHWIREIRGQGCLTAFELDHRFPISAAKMCDMMREKGVMAKQTHVYSIRLAPCLVATNADLEAALDAVEAVLSECDIPDFSPTSFI